jgi:4-hydroxy-tetrahydrodipicolinate synthase
MWSGMMPAVTTKFTDAGELDHAEMERCFALQIDAGNAGLITCGTLGEGNMLSPDERLAVLKIAKSVSGKKPALLTVSEAGTREACALAARAAKAGADGIMVVPSPIYHTNRAETIANLNAIANAGGLPVMIYSNRVGYRVDVTPEMMLELAENPLMVAIKESSDDIRRCTEIFNTVGNRFKVLTGVDNLGLEALLMGCDGWVSGVSIAFPKENQAIYDLAKAGRIVEAREIYRWLRPLLDLDVSTFLVQQIKLAEALAIGSNERVRAPRMALAGEHRARVEALIRERLACRPDLAKYAKAA